MDELTKELLNELNGASIDTHENFKGKVDSLCMDSKVGIAAYVPGNMGRYELIFGYSPPLNGKISEQNFFCAWMHRGGSGGGIIKVLVGGYTHWTYVKEKIGLSSQEDAKAIAHFINTLNFKGYKPAANDLPRGEKEAVND